MVTPTEQTVPRPAKTFVPALGFGLLTGGYDQVMARLARDGVIKPAIAAAVELGPRERALELGCGTGTLTLRLARAQPGAEIVALDADAKALRLARAKPEARGARVEWVESLCHEAKFAQASFDVVVSSLLFHHLTDEVKLETLRLARGWLKPGGRVVLADWARPHDVWMRLAFLGVQLLDGFGNTRANVVGRLPEMIEEAGFAGVRETRRWRTMFGTLALYQALNSA